MASGKVARRAAVDEIAALLDSPEVGGLVAELDELRWTGRKGYGARALVGACLVKTLYGLPTWTRAASLIADHPRLQGALGGCPSVWACYRFTTKLRAFATPGRADRQSGCVMDEVRATARRFEVARQQSQPARRWAAERSRMTTNVDERLDFDVHAHHPTSALLAGHRVDRDPARPGTTTRPLMGRLAPARIHESRA